METKELVLSEEIKGLTFNVHAHELEQLLRTQIGYLRSWVEKNALTDDEQLERFKLGFRRDLLEFLEFAADHLEHDATYQLSRSELAALFTRFED